MRNSWYVVEDLSGFLPVKMLAQKISHCCVHNWFHLMACVWSRQLDRRGNNNSNVWPLSEKYCSASLIFLDNGTVLVWRLVHFFMNKAKWYSLFYLMLGILWAGTNFCNSSHSSFVLEGPLPLRILLSYIFFN